MHINQQIEKPEIKSMYMRDTITMGRMSAPIMSKIRISREGLDIIIRDNKHNLDLFDVSNITDMSGLFKGIKSINGSISGWDVSNVTDMKSMFNGSAFNQDISSWNVSKVENMDSMFSCSNFNQNISGWDVSKVKGMFAMFYETPFNQDISSWDISSTNYVNYMFANSEFKQNLGSWDLSNKIIDSLFEDCPYSMEDYEKDRKNYLNNIILEKEKIIQKEISNLNESLNKNINISTLEMEF